jgi:large subunit ribosomal protein L21
VNGPKLEIGKFRRRKNSRRHTGHRQRYTSVIVTAIKVPGLKKAEK